MFRKFTIALVCAAMILPLASGRSQALPAETVTVTSSATVASGVYWTGGLIGVVAVLCIYDLSLKISGKKNWDGTPKSK